MVSSTSAAAPCRRVRRRSPIVAVALGVATAFGLREALCASLSFVLASRLSSPRELTKTRRHVVDEVVEKVPNKVKTVADTVAAFWTNYGAEPLLPMFRPYVIDFITQAHLSIVDSRFKYDAVWALGFRDYFTGMMGSYDRMVRDGETDKVWVALLKALDLDPEEVKSDAEAARAYAKATKPAEFLGNLERTTPASEPKVAAAFEGISKSLFTQNFAIGLFRLMEESGVELKKANVEEWCKALGLKTGRATTALDTYQAFQQKLAQAMELIREVEIREKKQLAQRLEQKAKALAAKQSEKKETSDEKELVGA